MRRYPILLLGILSLCTLSSCSGGSSGKDADTGPAGDADTDTDTDDDAACPPEACTAGRECLEVANPGEATTFTLRVMQATFARPEALAVGIVSSVLGGGITPAVPACEMGGSGTWNLLLGFDTSAGTLEVASARPQANAADPYAVIDETLAGLPVRPVSTSAPVGADGTFRSEPFDTVLAPFLDAAGTSTFLLPIRAGRVAGTLSDSHACVGAYDASGLEATACIPDEAHPAFTEAGTFEGYMTLEDADAVVIDSLGQSLCVLLSRDATTYGDGGFPERCARTAGVIDFMGDWCAATDTAAAAGCTDAVRLEFAFAASAVNVSR